METLVLRRQCKEQHNGLILKFIMNVTVMYHNNATKNCGRCKYQREMQGEEKINTTRLSGISQICLVYRYKEIGKYLIK